MAQEQQVIYGRNAVAEQLKSGAAADTLWLAASLDDGTARYYTALAKAAGAVVKRTGPEKLDEMSGGERHQGVALSLAQVAYCELEDLLQRAREKNEPPFLVLCDGVQDPHNLGAIIRSALLCGAHGVVVPKRGAAGVTPVAMKASAGAAALLPVARVANLGEAIRRLKQQNLFVWCADMDGTPLHRQNLGGPLALVVGGEGKGVGRLVRSLCDGAVALEMAPAGGVDSFNVSVAAGILLYKAAQDRKTPD